jgi:hypothetical protein
MYRPLDREKQEIRVIRLLDATPKSEAWAFEMQQVSLASDELSQTSALSYVWGQYDEEAKYISIDGMSLPITANLHAAISCIVGHDKLRASWWWIDAICRYSCAANPCARHTLTLCYILGINQEDIEERGFQVSLMRDLYSRAGQTVAYLGSDNDGTSKGLKWLETMDNTRLGKNLKKEQWIEEAAKNPDMEDHWRGMDAIFRKVWWERAWVLQESVVSPTLLFLCGQSLLSEEIMFGALFYMRICQKKIYNRLAELRVTMDGWSHHFSTIMHRLRLRGKYERGGEIPFSSLLDLRLDLQATNPRDYVYGLFSLAGSKNELVPTPNYVDPVWKVYSDWVTTWIRQRQNLDILTLSGWPRGDVDFPSWVPDINYRTTTGSAYISPDSIWVINMICKSHYEEELKDAKTDASIDLPDPKTATFRASGSMKAEFNILDNNLRAVQCQGIRIDTVDGIAGTQGLIRSASIYHTAGPAIANRQPKGTATAYGSFEKTKAAIWRSVITDRILPHLSRPAPDYGGAIFAKECAEIEIGKGDGGWKPIWNIIRDFNIGGRSLLNWFSGDLADLRIKAWEGLTEHRNGLDVAKSMIAPKNPVIDRSKHILCEMQRHLFVSEKGYVGLLTTNAEPGDEVWILLGCNIPLLLRKHDDGKRTLIGECYVHGIMYGEAVKELESGEKKAVPVVLA